MSQHDVVGAGTDRFVEPSGRKHAPCTSVGSDSLRDLFARAFDFRLSDILRLRSFVILGLITVAFVYQIRNTIKIQKLALVNEKLREQIAMSSSVIASQELKVNELQGIHKIAVQAESLGLQASSVPAVEIVPESN